MKIKEIRIENFGKLSNQNFTFNDGLNEQLEDNGWGKSTLAAFIRVMFYGFENETKRVAEREREIIRPWAGGVYGGSIIFEYKGKEYKLTRTFGNRAADDRFFLLDNKTGFESSDFTAKIGEELFQIDADSFGKTIYIAQNDINTSPTTSIHAKLGNLAQATDDIGDFDKIDKKLKDELNKISSRTATGEISKITNQITTIEAELRLAPGIDNAIDSFEKSIAESKAEQAKIAGEMKTLQDEQAAAAAEGELITKRTGYENAVEERETRRQSRDSIRAEFPLGVPKKEDLDACIATARSADKLLGEASKVEIDDDDKKILERGADVFKGSVPSETEIESNVNTVETIKEKQAEYDRLQFSEEENQSFENLSKVFDGKGDVSKEAEELIRDWEARSSKKGALATKKASLDAMKAMAASKKEEKPAESKTWLIILLAGLFIAIIGIIAAAALHSAVIGIVIAAAGLILAVAGIISKSKKPAAKEAPVDDAPPIWDSLESEIRDDEKLIADTDGKVGAFLKGYGFDFDENRASSELYSVKNNYESYKALKDKKDDPRDDRLMEEIRSLKSNVEAFLLPYAPVLGDEKDMLARLYILKTEAGRYSDAERKQSEYSKLMAEFDKANTPLQAFIAGLGMQRGAGESDIEYLNRAKSRLGVLNSAEAEYKKTDDLVREKEAEADFLNYRDAVRSRTAIPMTEFEQRMNEYRNNDAALTDKIVADSTALDDKREEKDALDEKAAQLTELKDRKEKLENREKLLAKTKELLNTAKNNFTLQYTAPVTNAFKKYYDMFNETTGPDYTFRADSTMMINDQGAERRIDSYSAGMKDKINLCFRMALIDTMFKSEKPMIIMDDPFTNLDATRLTAAKQMMAEIAASYQVLYFTCHESRRV